MCVCVVPVASFFSVYFCCVMGSYLHIFRALRLKPTYNQQYQPTTPSFTLLHHSHTRPSPPLIAILPSQSTRPLMNLPNPLQGNTILEQGEESNVVAVMDFYSMQVGWDDTDRFLAVLNETEKKKEEKMANDSFVKAVYGPDDDNVFKQIIRDHREKLMGTGHK